MAFLPNEPGEPKWQITDVGDFVLLIENPGLDNEKTHFKWDLTYGMGATKAIREVTDFNFLSTEQRAMTVFWLGYFYATFSKR